MTRVTGEWLKQSATQRIFALLTKAGFQAYVVGGSVRNALMGVDVADIDFATDARPEDRAETCRRRSDKKRADRH